MQGVCVLRGCGSAFRTAERLYERGEGRAAPLPRCGEGLSPEPWKQRRLNQAGAARPSQREKGQTQRSISRPRSSSKAAKRNQVKLGKDEATSYQVTGSVLRVLGCCAGKKLTTFTLSFSSLRSCCTCSPAAGFTPSIPPVPHHLHQASPLLFYPFPSYLFTIP